MHSHSRPRSSFLVARMTWAPQLASDLQISNPNPVLPPVTIATLPSMSTLVMSDCMSVYFLESLATAVSTIVSWFVLNVAKAAVPFAM